MPYDVKKLNNLYHARLTLSFWRAIITDASMKHSRTCTGTVHQGRCVNTTMGVFYSITCVEIISYRCVSNGASVYG